MTVPDRVDQLTPTAEQQRCIDLARTGLDLAVEAGAGAGKTTTIDMIARDLRSGGIYTAFNKRLVEEAAETLDQNLTVRTFHSLAYRTHGAQMRHRLSGERMRSDEIGRRLGLNGKTVRTKAGSKHLSRGFFGSLAMKSMDRFCQSDRDEPSIWDVPLPRAARYDPVFKEIYEDIRYTLEPVLQAMWDDLSSLDGKLPANHGVYLKKASLDRVQLGAPVLFVDEAQDLAPVAISWFLAQRGTQIIAVGDDAQVIFGFTGSKSLLRHMPNAHRATLSESFRFGPPIAEVANGILEEIPGTTMRIVGRGGPSTVGPIDEPDVILFRTNAGTVRQAFNELEADRKFHIVGGAADVVSFCKGARDLMNGRPAFHPDLVCFGTWSEVVLYADEDERGVELALLVGLIEKFGVDEIIFALENQASEADADVLLSTAHKVKGLQWDRVRLGSDFPEEVDDEETLKLLYVATTRAKKQLDVSSLAYFAESRRPPAAEATAEVVDQPALPAPQLALPTT